MSEVRSNSQENRTETQAVRTDSRMQVQAMRTDAIEARKTFRSTRRSTRGTQVPVDTMDDM